MATKLERIAQLSKENPNMVFTSIGHLINIEMLADCHIKMDGKKAEGKCRLIEFGRFAEQNRKRRNEGKPESFDFLGFTHVCSKSKYGKFKVRRITSRKKFIKKWGKRGELKGQEIHNQSSNSDKSMCADTFPAFMFLTEASIIASVFAET